MFSDVSATNDGNFNICLGCTTLFQKLEQLYLSFSCPNNNGIPDYLMNWGFHQLQSLLIYPREPRACLSPLWWVPQPWVGHAHLHAFSQTGWTTCKRRYEECFHSWINCKLIIKILCWEEWVWCPLDKGGNVHTQLVNARGGPGFPKEGYRNSCLHCRGSVTSSAPSLPCSHQCRHHKILLGL